MDHSGSDRILLLLKMMRMRNNCEYIDNNYSKMLNL